MLKRTKLHNGHISIFAAICSAKVCPPPSFLKSPPPYFFLQELSDNASTLVILVLLLTDLFNFFPAGDKDTVKFTTKTPAFFGSASGGKAVLKLKGGKPKLQFKSWTYNDMLQVGDSVYDYDKKVLEVETTTSNIPGAPGATVDVNVKKDFKKDLLEFPMTVTYEQGDLMNATLDCTAPAFDEFTAACTLSTDGLTVGGALNLKPGDDKAVGDYPISLSYGMGPYFGAIEATDAMTTFTVKGLYQPSKELTLAAAYELPDESGNVKYNIYAKYAPPNEYKADAACHVSLDSSKSKSANLNLTSNMTPVKGATLSANCVTSFADFQNDFKWSTGISLG